MTTQIVQRTDGATELRTVISVEDLMNRGMMEALKDKVLEKAVEVVMAKHRDDLVKHVDFKAIGQALSSHLDMKAIANGVARAVVEEVFAKQGQEIIAKLNLDAIANMTAAYTARLAADTLVAVPRG